MLIPFHIIIIQKEGKKEAKNSINLRKVMGLYCVVTSARLVGVSEELVMERRQEGGREDVEGGMVSSSKDSIVQK